MEMRWGLRRERTPELAAAGARERGSWGARVVAAATLVATALSAGCAARPERSLEVKASAYTSHASQTSGDPWVAAWGDTLDPDMKAIAVSRDLIDLGLIRGTRVRIEGLPGEYVVLDKMAKRWRRKIDIYMGEDVQAARRWGVRNVRIRWRPPRSPDAP